MGILIVFYRIFSAVLYFTTLAAIAGEPSSRVAMDVSLLKRLGTADVVRGQTLAASCAACHDSGGIGPLLDGQLSTYLYKQLQDYKAGHRENPLMSGVAASLTTEDQIDLAAYYARKAPQERATERIRPPRLVTEGDSRRILPPCAACHGVAGEGQKLDIPAIRGLAEGYLLTTLKAYQDGSRHNDLYGRMRSLVKDMTTEELSELARYYSSLGH